MAANLCRSVRFLCVSSRRCIPSWLGTAAKNPRYFSTTQYLRDIERRYAKSHEWATLVGDTAKVGISNHAQDLLGELVYVDLPDVGDVLAREDICGTAESVKAAADIYAPLSGTVKAVNGELEENPSLVNEDPTGAGWIVELTVSNTEEYNDLMTEEEYKKFLEEEN